jgi:hypothetical protein
VCNDTNTNHDAYLHILSRGGLTIPSQSLKDFVFQAFSILDFISTIIHDVTGSKNDRKVAEEILLQFISKTVKFTCHIHESWGVKYSLRVCINIFYNNKQKLTNETVRKDQIDGFKKRQTEKDY